MESIGGSIGSLEKAKQGNLWDGIKRQNGETHSSFTLVGTGLVLIFVYSTCR